jgi:hypothetical protein
MVMELTRLFRHSSKSLAIKEIVSPRLPLLASRNLAEMIFKAGDIVVTLWAALISNGIEITRRSASRRADIFFIKVTVPFSKLLYFVVCATIFALLR